VTTRVRRAVKASGIPEYTVAKLAGIPNTTFGRRLDGINPWNVDEIEAVAKAIGVDPNDLIPQSTDRSAS
jgi:hypothetical protein